MSFTHYDDGSPGLVYLFYSYAKDYVRFALILLDVVERVKVNRTPAKVYYLDVGD